MIINELCGRNVLCKQGEYGIEVSFDYSEWLNEFGSGSVGWAFQRSHDTSAYLLPDVEADGVSTVTLTETESQYSGQARLEVFFVNDGQTEKRISRTFDFMIQPSLQNLGDVPTEWQSYIDAVHQYATDAENAKEANENMSATASVDDNFGVPSVAVTKTVSDHVNLDFAFTNLKGNGITGMEEVERIGLVVRYRITFDDGMTYEFDVEDGNGIASAVLNADYSLTLTFTNGTSYTTPSIKGDKGDKGDKGNVMFATFVLNPQTGVLSMLTDDEYSGANFSINNYGYLEVSI